MTSPKIWKRTSNAHEFPGRAAGRGAEDYPPTPRSAGFAIQVSRTSYASWFYRSLTSINGMACCVEDHLYEKFNLDISREEEDQWMKLMSALWPSDSKQFVEQKLRDKAKYNEDVARHSEAKLNPKSKSARVSPPTGSSTTNNIAPETMNIQRLSLVRDCQPWSLR